MDPMDACTDSSRLTEEMFEVLRGCCFDDTRYPQYFHTRKALEAGKCAFCFPDPKLNTVLYDRFGWIAWEVPTTFTNRASTLDLQLVFFPKRHIRHLNELTIFQWFGFYMIIKWIYRKYHIPGGGFLARVGDMRWNIGTVMHFHFNLYVPNRKGGVNFVLQNELPVWQDKESRMKKFAARYEAGEVPERT